MYALPKSNVIHKMLVTNVYPHVQDYCQASSKKRQANQSGEIPIYLRLTKSRKVRLVSSGIKVAQCDWNANKEIVRKSHPSSASINYALHKLKRKAEESVYAGSNVDEVIQEISVKGQGSTLGELIKKTS